MLLAAVVLITGCKSSVLCQKFSNPGERKASLYSLPTGLKCWACYWCSSFFFNQSVFCLGTDTNDTLAWKREIACSTFKKAVHLYKLLSLPCYHTIDMHPAEMLSDKADANFCFTLFEMLPVIISSEHLNSCVLKRIVWWRGTNENAYVHTLHIYWIQLVLQLCSTD